MTRLLRSLLLSLLLLPACRAAAPAAPAPVAAGIVTLSPPPTPLITPWGPAPTTPAATVAPPTEAPASATVAPTSTVAPSPTVAPTAALPTPVVAVTATPDGWRVGADADVPAAVVAAARALVEGDGRFIWSDGEADVRLTREPGGALATWIYALAVPFATVRDAIGWEEARATPGPLGPLYLDAPTAAAWPNLPATITAPPDLVGAVWVYRPAWTLVPFDALRPEYKVLRVDGRSPLDRDFTPDGYPLAIGVGLAGDPEAGAAFLAAWGPPRTNRDPERLTTVALTGVSAPARSVGWHMQIAGVTSPGQAVAPVLAAADIAHVSNEIPFAVDCPPSEQQPIGDAVFCAPDSHLELFTSIGADVVELTGNHVNDWGEANFRHTLDLYAAASLATFGGGRDLAAAEQPSRWEHHGNRIAFVGCNPVGPYGAWARPGYAGSRPCGDYAGIQAQIAELKAAGYLVIATLQYQEYYAYQPAPDQRRDFRALLAAGAIAVSGSQGHHAQGFDFLDGGFIHYGLGNLFFDQMEMAGTRQTFVDTYTFYEGRLLNVSLWTGLIEAYCCPREMTPAEREGLLRTVFAASGW